MRKKEKKPLNNPKKRNKRVSRKEREKEGSIIRTREEAAELSNETHSIIEKLKTDKQTTDKSDVCLKWYVFKGNGKRNTQRNEAIYFRTRSFAARDSNLTGGQRCLRRMI